MSEHPTLSSILSLQLLNTLKMLNPFPRVSLKQKKAIAPISLFISQEVFNRKKDFLITFTQIIINIEKQRKIKTNEFSNLINIKMSPLQLSSHKQDLISSKASLLCYLQFFSFYISNQVQIRSDRLILIESKMQKIKKQHLIETLSKYIIIENKAKSKSTDYITSIASISDIIQYYYKFIKGISQI
ncbi:hypothetical protein ABPG74_013730 [Tetrahymena malaccensis]